MKFQDRELRRGSSNQGKNCDKRKEQGQEALFEGS
jgi:hypothetical protein